VPSPVRFLPRLPYPRVICLLLAAIQLMPLPEEPEARLFDELSIVAVGPDPWSQRSPLEGGISMPLDDKQLHQIAQDYPWFMFTVEEIATLCNVSRDFVSKVRGSTDGPFCLNKCRPEWFAEWMRAHPDFQLTKEIPFRPKSLAQRHHAKIGGRRKRDNDKEAYV
jgi:hypothetical protein